MDHVLIFLGLALISAGLLQFGLWTGRGLRLQRMDRQKFETELEMLHAELYKIRKGIAAEPTSTTETPVTETPPLQPGSWHGFRPFYVARLNKETENCTSVYLVPADGQPIAGYQPGQHLTLRFPVPNCPAPPIRCYTLSDAPDEDCYRISVKQCGAPADKPDAPPGLVSHYVNQQLRVGDVIDVKAPSGSFFLQPGMDPVVLLAGGIGITPMLSMLKQIVTEERGRQCLLVHGVRNSADHAFKHILSELAARHTNIHVVYCYSHPLPAEQAGTDYHVPGFVSADLLKRILPGQSCDFYMCGPPPFMQSLYSGLREWGVDNSRIRYEAFGPATVQRDDASTDKSLKGVAGAKVTLARSGLTVDWDDRHEHLLELLEAQDIPVDSGCRAGSCGTCQTRLLKGQVSYADPAQIECETGYCLPCMAVPAEPVELDV